MRRLQDWRERWVTIRVGLGRNGTGLPPDFDELDLDYHEWEDQGPPSARDIDVENLMMLKRQRNFRRAAEHVAEAIARQPAVHQIVLFGSAAMPLKKEIPRFRQFRRAGIAIWHECGDIDLAVWVDNLDCLNELRRSLSGALNELMQKSDIGVAHHQVDAHIMEPGSKPVPRPAMHIRSVPKARQRRM